MIPTEAQCIELLEKYGVTGNTAVYKHSVKVRDICMLLASKLIAAGESIDLKLMKAGALLHDIRKYDEIKAKKQGNPSYAHNIEGALTVKREGFPELQSIIENHLFYNPALIAYTIEEKILCYTDRRVKMDMVVSLADRYSDLANRYPTLKRELLADQTMVIALEKELFAKLNITPEDIGSLLN